MLTVIGIGNSQFGDDGIASAIIAKLRSSSCRDSEMEFIEIGLDALELLEYLPNRNQVLIVDAARMGKNPGTIRIFKPTDAHLILKWDHLSLHGLGLAEACQLAAELGILPDQFWIMGIQPANVNLGASLSKPVSAAIPRAVRLIRRLAQQFLPAEIQTIGCDHNDFD